MTYFLRDILRQPKELRRTIHFLLGPGRASLNAATAAVRAARHAYLTGIGSSWHAALSAGTLFSLGGCPVYMQDASELLEFAAFPRNSVAIVISRSGRSIEIVKLLAKLRESEATVIAITNSAEGPLAREAQIPIVVPIELDHAISVNTYSTFAATYFLARGSSFGSCQEARLLWEEGVKSPATAMGTGSFRHGPQEMVAAGARFGIWIAGERTREQDLAVARDLRKLGASVMLIGRDIPGDAGDLVFQVPDTPANRQFLIDIIPAQLAAEKLARLSGVDSDTFRYCSFIVEDEYG